MYKKKIIKYFKSQWILTPIIDNTVGILNFIENVLRAVDISLRLLDTELKSRCSNKQNLYNIGFSIPIVQRYFM